MAWITVHFPELLMVGTGMSRLFTAAIPEHTGLLLPAFPAAITFRP
jgi:hypothetical protein